MRALLDANLFISYLLSPADASPVITVCYNGPDFSEAPQPILEFRVLEYSRLIISKDR